MPSETSSPPSTPPAALWRALAMLLRPLVRGLIALGITQPQLAEFLKSIYVEVASGLRDPDGRGPNQSRLSVMTGVHRKDVKRLLAEPPAGEAPPSATSIGARLIGVWLGTPGLCDGEGRPLPLPRLPTEGGPSFEALVQGVSKDIRPRAVLDEWLRQGIATLDGADRVHLSASAFVPNSSFDDLAYYFGRNLRDHIAASTHNLLGGAPPLLERAVYYDRLRPESVEALAALSRDWAMRALTAVNAEALRLADADEGAPEATHRIAFGTYVYRADEAAERADDAATRAAAGRAAEEDEP
ncbi:MAG TPA: DUF6502 family protein [Alphaproteobacteria bacterium]|nr:DUF6502 family protein [Alphaproteobacteria bacterium]